jgi:hypothetical protein
VLLLHTIRVGEKWPSSASFDRHLATTVSVMPEARANCWRCCECREENLYALYPTGSECSHCFEHRNVGCCRPLKRIPTGIDPLPIRPNRYADDFKDFLATPAVVRDRAFAVPELQAHALVSRDEGGHPDSASAVENGGSEGDSQAHPVVPEYMLDQTSSDEHEDETLNESQQFPEGFLTHCRRLWSRACEPRLRADFVRIRYRCACGDWMWDDYPAALAGKASRLEARLRKSSQQASGDTVASSSTGGPPAAQPDGAAAPRGFFSGLSRRLFRRTAMQRVDAESQSGPRQGSGSPDSDGGYYLTCLPVSTDRRPILVQIKEGDIDEDHAYFSSLRENVKQLQRPWRRLFNPRKVKAIRYVLVS